MNAYFALRNRTGRYLFSLLVALCFAWSVSATAADAADTAFTSKEAVISRVFDLVEARLALMRDVAANKYLAKQAIVDEVREQAVLDSVVQNSQALGLDATATRKVFDVQIRMARAIQLFWTAQWQRNGEAVSPLKSLSEIRPRLDAIGEELLIALYLARGELRQQEPEPLIATRIAALTKHVGIDVALLDELADALRTISVTRPISTQMIRRARVLRVGTTGDYAPFSYERSGELLGFDVQLAQVLAAELGAKVQFVRTSWSTLMQDMQSQRFDIAMSGITVTPERAAQAEFAIAYHADGKTPLARCENRRKFATLAAIDQPQVRLIVNPGGTNQMFVRDRIRRAIVIEHADNRTIFAELIARRADVMITDGIEADLQALRHKQLCRPTAAMFTQNEKAPMLPAESDLKLVVDRWLMPRVASGEIHKKLNQALSDAR